MILLSRNSPVALVVGAAGFIGSHLVEKLLEKGIQVIGVDELTTGRKENLTQAAGEKKFHFICQSFTKQLELELYRLDYAVFLITESANEELYARSFSNFLEYCRKHRAKILLVTSVELYNQNEESLADLRKAELELAQFTHSSKANARVVRLTDVYGPRMHFRSQDPVSRLIQAALLKTLQKETTTLDFSTRSIFVEDSVKLLLKALLSGGTTHKIYDGSLYHPIKVAEIKQVLLDPVWHENRGFTPTPLPPWPTPNLEKTQKELSWKASEDIVSALRKTLAYFNENPDLVNQATNPFSPKEEKLTPEIGEEKTDKKESAGKKVEPRKITLSSINAQVLGPANKNRTEKGKNLIGICVWIALITYGLLYPLASLITAGFGVSYHLKKAESALVKNDFEQAETEIGAASRGMEKISNFYGSLEIIRRSNWINNKLTILDNSLEVANEVVEASLHGVVGLQALNESLKVVAGEKQGDLSSLFSQARTELSRADEQFNNSSLNLNNNLEAVTLPATLKSSIEDYQNKITYYQQVLKFGKLASYILPQALSLDRKRSYLVILQNNFQIRPTGGVPSSYAQIDFDQGRLVNIKTAKASALSQQISASIKPPDEIIKDLGKNEWVFEDVNIDPDFPTSAKNLADAYLQATGVKVAGVITLDLEAAAKLSAVLGGIYLTDLGLKVDANNLVEKTISLDNTISSQLGAKKDFLTLFYEELIKGLFFLPKTNLSSLATVILDSLSSKGVLIYLTDPELTPYIVAENWGGVLPGVRKSEQGRREESIALFESNISKNLVNYYISRKLEFESTILTNGVINSKLTASYTNNSLDNRWPGGNYKSRMKIYLPTGSRLNAITWGGESILKQVSSFSDYNRAGYSFVVELSPKAQKNLVFEYTADGLLQFVNNKAVFKVAIIKQPGSKNDALNLKVLYPPEFKIASGTPTFASTLSQDRSFEMTFAK